MRKLTKATLALAGVSAMMLAAPSTAQAASSSCSVNGYAWWLNNTCYTQSVWAQSGGHWIDIHVGPYAGCGFDYKVRDVANNVVIHSGRTYGDYDKTLFNVYSAYRLEVTRVGGNGCGGDAIIENEV